MNAYNINISTKKADIIPDIMVALSKYDCDIRINKQKEKKDYTFSYNDMSFSKIGVKEGRTKEQYINEMKLYKHAGNVLTSFGVSSKHKGYLYAIECIRLINTYGQDYYKMDSDVYPVVATWYDVSPQTIEHNIRNAITNAWNKAINRDDFSDSSFSIFEKKPTNIKFLKHIAKITNYSLINAETNII